MLETYKNLLIYKYIYNMYISCDFSSDKSGGKFFFDLCNIIFCCHYQPGMFAFPSKFKVHR